MNSAKPIRAGALLALLCAGLVVVGHWATLRTPLVSDEPTHLAQVLLLLDGKGGRHPFLTTFETFHWFAAQGARLIGSSSGSTVRLVSTLLGFLVVAGAFLAASRVQGSRVVGAMRAATIMFMPVLFPFVFLIYTDAFALAVICFAVWSAERKRYFFAGMLGLLAVAIRQTNIIWLAWLFVVFLARERPWLELRSQWSTRLIEAAPFALGAAAFCIFVWLNGGVAIGDPLSHPAGLYDENLFFFLLVSLVILLPLIVARIPETWALVSRSPKAASAAALVIGAGFLTFWKADHWYNVLPHHIHNEVAMWLNDIGNRIVLAPLIVWTFFGLLELRRSGVETALWIGATVLVLVPSYMIEPRYSIVPLALFTIYRPTLPRWQENVALFWVIILGVAAFTLTSRGSFTI